MNRDVLDLILANLRAKQYKEAVITLNAIESCGGYSSAQCTMRVKIDTVLCEAAFVTFPAWKGREKYNPFACGKLISGGEPVYIPYSSIICVIGVEQ